MIEMRTCVATPASRFEPTLAPGQIVGIDPQVNLRKRHPMQMHVRMQ